jgi:hypothetical protein
MHSTELGGQFEPETAKPLELGFPATVNFIFNQAADHLASILRGPWACFNGLATAASRGPIENGDNPISSDWAGVSGLFKSRAGDGHFSVNFGQS